MEEFFKTELAKRKNQDILRVLKPKSLNLEKIDFSSNDYLGMAKSQLSEFSEEEMKYLQLGAGGARLLNGNHDLLSSVENQIAKFHNTDSALLFESGYQANIALLSAILTKDTDVFYDKLSHASIKDGIRLSFANKQSFIHNNFSDLENKVKASKKHKVIIVEAVYSMDGDSPDWEKLLQICEKYNVFLIVDEAHSAGVFGENGEGFTYNHPINKWIVAKTITFGKSFGVSGAAIIGSDLLKQFLINYSRGFIYNTAMLPIKTFLIGEMYKKVADAHRERKLLWENIDHFKSKSSTNFIVSKNNAPIQYILCKDVSKTKIIAQELNKSGIWVYPIVYPTVRQGDEKIRLILHSFNTFKEIDLIFEQLECFKV